MNISALFLKAIKPRSNRGRILLWSCLATIIFGGIEMGKPLDDFLRDGRNAVRKHPVKGDITLVAIDDHSFDVLGSYPWPRRHYGTLAQELNRLGARRIFFDVITSSKSTPKDDKAFAEAIVPLGRKVVLPVMFSIDPVSGRRTDTYPLPELRQRADLAHINFQYDIFGTVRRLPYALGFGDRVYSSFAAMLAESPRLTGDFPIDFSLNPRTIPTVSAADVIQGKVNRSAIAGKDVIIGPTAMPMNDSYVAPGTGVVPGVFLHILGAETLKAGTPLELTWFQGLLPAILIVCAAGALNSRLFSVVSIGAGLLGIASVPFLLESHMIYVDVTPPLFLMLTAGTALSWFSLRKTYRARGTTNQVSGLPNLNALAQIKSLDRRVLIAARVQNYAAIISNLSGQGEKAFVDQIAKRLMLGAATELLYQGDEGIFAWFGDAGGGQDTGSHLDALHTLFRSPVTVEGQQFDLELTFGFESETERSIGNRLAGALAAADDAGKEGSKWKEFDPSQQGDSAWRLSLLSQLDAAIDAGDLWVAYQPKLDLASGRIIGAEALARWTHPDKGPISPLEFILAAEKSDRIEKLTHSVLEHAIRAASTINKQGVDFSISVNISARLIGDHDLVRRVQALLEKHGLSPSHLTLEVTETAALGSSAQKIETLQRLRDMGVSISVDDYGTGLSTLEYLQRIPATEIKIDRSFVVAMRENQATRVMVNSTIQLAHSLGQKVVAEGIEDEETLAELRRMNCDIGQGYLIGRPMTFRALSKKMVDERNGAIA